MNVSWRYGLVLAAVVLVANVVSYSGPDLPPGPYCAAKPNSCCNGREDRCSAPILGTLCYCDDFCNRTTSDDCCPDFWSHCHGVTEPPPPEIRGCYYNGREYRYQQKSKTNCNECECTEVNGKLDMVCQADPCIIEAQLISDVNSDVTISWRASNYTPFWGHKLSEGIELRLGTLTPHKSTFGMIPMRYIYDSKRMPRSFNTIESNWPKKITGIRDQGWCGSSWAITTADVASDRFVIMSNGLETPQLSAQQLLSCNNRGQQSCNGGYLDIAWQYSRKFGLVNEDCFPYVGGNKKCTIPSKRTKTLRDSGCTPPSKPSTRINRYTVSPAHRLGNETDIMYELINSGPVQATMKVYQDFFSYTDGIYKKSQHAPLHLYGYHSVRIVGWGDENGIKYWLAANSWGESWGENGYFRIVRGINECDIESFVIGVWAFTVENKVGVVG